MLRAAKRDIGLARAIVACAQIIKGYGDTHAHAIRSFGLIAQTYFNDEITPARALTQAIRAAHEAALSDPEGDSLARGVAAWQAG